MSARGRKRSPMRLGTKIAIYLLLVAASYAVLHVVYVTPDTRVEVTPGVFPLDGRAVELQPDGRWMRVDPGSEIPRWVWRTWASVALVGAFRFLRRPPILRED